MTQQRQPSGSMLDASWRAIFTIGYRAARIWWFVLRPEQRGAYVALWFGDELLTIRNSYKPGVTIPCGGIGRGESPRDAARRELSEEVGIEVAPAQLIPTDEIFFENEYKRDHVHFFELRCELRPTVRIDHREVVAAEFVALGDLASRPLVPAVRGYLERRHGL